MNEMKERRGWEEAKIHSVKRGGNLANKPAIRRGKKLIGEVRKGG
jgi:hypothetical protein